MLVPIAGQEKMYEVGEEKSSSPEQSQSRAPIGFWGIVGAVLVANLITGIVAMLAYSSFR